VKSYEGRLFLISIQVFNFILF